ncbi:hypothetical protein SERLA73DRAFT_57720, partial [Serpula lacrymans var. lacrymans S7.3]
YPVLSLMACDYLAIQGSSVAAERVFSSGDRTSTVLRNKLLSETFEALQSGTELVYWILREKLLCMRGNLSN